MAADELRGMISDVVQRHQREQGRQPVQHLPNVVIPRGAHMQMGEHFNAQPTYDNSPAANHSYDALERDTWQQFEIMTRSRSKGGLGLTANTVPYDAYGRENKSQPFADHWQNIIRDARQDVGENHRIEALSTEATGGTPNFRDPDTNDAFRAVHDVFGHIAANRGVDHQGEEGAYQHHRQMFSPEARPALANMLREQIGFMQRYGDFPPLKHALGHDSGPIAPEAYGESRAKLEQGAWEASRAQGLVNGDQHQRRWRTR
jgi:hypothetical protein